MFIVRLKLTAESQNYSVFAYAAGSNGTVSYETQFVTIENGPVTVGFSL